MASWNITNADRNSNGRVRAPGFDDDTSGTAFTAALDRSLAEVGATPADEPAPATPAAPWTRSQIALTIGSVLLVLASLAALIVTAGPEEAPRPLTTPPPAISATVADLRSPTPAVLARLDHAIVAFSAPAGEALGAIEAGRAYTATAAYGAAWLQLDIAGSGLVWVRAADVPEASRAGLADLAPPPTLVPPPPTSAPPVVVVPPPVQAAPTVCAESIAGMGCGGNAATAQANLQLIEATSRASLETSTIELGQTLVAATATAERGGR